MMRDITRKALIGYFVAHLIMSVLLDLQPLPFLENVYPDFLKSVIQFHAESNNDYLMTKPFAPWFMSIVWLELLFQVPFFYFAAAGFLARRNSVRIPCIIYGSSAATQVLAIMGDILGSDEVTDAERYKLILIYMPWLVIPAAVMLIMAFDPTPFGPDVASKQK